MKSTVWLVTTCLLVALAGPGASLAQEKEEKPEAISRFYQVHYLRSGMVEILGRQQCGGDFRHGVCKMSFGSEGFVEFTAPVDAQDRFAEMLAEKDVPPPTQIFQVHVLRAKAEEQEMPRLPIDAVHALMDLQQLLPFRGFELVDSGLMRTSGQAELFLGSDRRYQAHLRFEGDPVAGKPLQIDFRLVADKLVRDEAGDVKIQGVVNLLGTTFSMKVGETVVVGTSKLNGGSEALVVLLSAGS
jgi:hypothetical protein